MARTDLPPTTEPVTPAAGVPESSGAGTPVAEGLLDLRPSELAARHSVIATRYHRRDDLRRRLLAACDLIGLSLGMLAASQVRALRFDSAELLLWCLATLPAWIVLFKAYGLYERDLKRVSHTTVDDIPWLFHAFLLGTLLLWLYTKVVPVTRLVFPELLVFGGVAAGTILILRSSLRGLMGRLVGPDRVLLIGNDDMTAVLVRKLRAHREYGLDPVGLITHGDADGDAPRFLPVLGSLEELDLARVVEEHNVDRILFSHSQLNQAELVEVLRLSRQLRLKVGVLPQFMDALGPAVEADEVEGVTILGLNPPVLSKTSRSLKRSLDVAVSATTLLLTAPLMAAIALAIKLDSRGPVFFRQPRIGKGASPFRLIKFRTMEVGAEERLEELLAQSRDPHWLLLERDPRVTRVGRFLRLTSLDELPQLWNVLKGEMSLVGPRPLIESEDRLIGGWARARLDLTPGITGLWQVLGRSNIPFEEMVKLDYLYVASWSLWSDIRIILRTLPVVLLRRGAK